MPITGAARGAGARHHRRRPAARAGRAAGAGGGAGAGRPVPAGAAGGAPAGGPHREGAAQERRRRPLRDVLQGRGAAVPRPRAGDVRAGRLQPRVVQHATQIHTVVGLVGAGLGVAVVPATRATCTAQRALRAAGRQGGAGAHRAGLAARAGDAGDPVLPQGDAGGWRRCRAADAAPASMARNYVLDAGAGRPDTRAQTLPCPKETR
jgi:hypothetical protein